MNILINIVIAAIVFVAGVNVPAKYLPQLPTEPNFGNVSITGITTATNLASFPAIYNTDMDALNDGKIDISTTTISTLVSIGTIMTGVWNGTAIGVLYGGTGTTSPTSNLVMLGNGSSGLKTVNGFGTTGQFLTSNGDSTAPTWETSSVDLAANYV